ncbi:ATP-dependent Clp protease proteolytic subunit 4, chloroplastic-like isoform X2 [Papaver somniferum]|uniref:ATP-dependent Clp protease proteolytic subunit 4, chloroplastic-like isoform X2 n=1 Tax=Papaver somniferum TaxID=3469 RepID=UPI000E706091|nr:ATP-dependent Clp protease proteolytic subunit 4, chloroplastic-like isoform X2 [Papaver somniferum]
MISLPMPLSVNCYCWILKIPGGSLRNLQCYNGHSWSSDVFIVELGIAASTAAIILNGSSKGKRFAMPNTRIMLHQPLGGQVIDVEIKAKEIMHNKIISLELSPVSLVELLNKLKKILTVDV